MSEPTLFFNGAIHTIDDHVPRATWFTVLGDRFQRVGSDQLPPVKRRIDLGGKPVVPGFVDAHAHFFQTGLDLLSVNLAKATTLAEIIARLEAGAAGGKRKWTFAHSFEEDVLTDLRRLTRHELDPCFGERPVWINRVDYHSAVVNTAALRRLEIPAGTRGLIASDGEPNGILRSEAYLYAKARVARLYPVEVKEQAVRAAAKQCVEHGITAVHALEGGRIFGDEGLSTLVRRIPSLPLHVTVFLQEKNVVFTTGFGFRHLGGCILVDGSIGSYTAALDADYEGFPGQRGVVYEKPREFSAFVAEAHEAGTQLAFHAIGPRAIDLVLEAYDRALAKEPRYDHRHRIEHFELATDDQISRARDLGVIASMQPSFEYFWGGPSGMYAARIGRRWRNTNRLRTILDRGVTIAGGSDTNVTPPWPLLGIHAAVNHPNPEQRVSVAEAVRMMTINAAFAAFNDKLHGSISAGKQASFVVLDADPFAVPASELGAISVVETWYCGRNVYRRDAEPSA